MNKQQAWSLTTNGMGLYTLTLISTEGEDKIWVDENELIQLKQFLASLDLPLENDLPL